MVQIEQFIILCEQTVKVAKLISDQMQSEKRRVADLENKRISLQTDVAQLDEKLKLQHRNKLEDLKMREDYCHRKQAELTQQKREIENMLEACKKKESDNSNQWQELNVKETKLNVLEAELKKREDKLSAKLENIRR